MTSRERLERVILGTVAVHVVIIVVLDIAGTWAVRHPPDPEPEQIELDDTPPPKEEPPKKFVMPELPRLPDLRAPVPQPVARPQVARTEPRPATHEPPPPTDEPPPSTSDQQPEPGGDTPTIDMSGVTGNVGIPSGHGRAHTGAGTGTGTGVGSGSGPPPAAPPAPVSIAAIKTPAKPRGDYSYFGAGKDYPAEARQLGVEGTIRVRLIVDAQGRVTAKVLLNKLGHGLDELALARAGQIEFDPALDERDQPVASVVVWTFQFKLPD